MVNKQNIANSTNVKYCFYSEQMFWKLFTINASQIRANLFNIMVIYVPCTLHWCNWPDCNHFKKGVPWVQRPHKGSVPIPTLLRACTLFPFRWLMYNPICSKRGRVGTIQGQITTLSFSTGSRPNKNICEAKGKSSLYLSPHPEEHT
jgi:hypothetical protein